MPGCFLFFSEMKAVWPLDRNRSRQQIYFCVLPVSIWNSIGPKKTWKFENGSVCVHWKFYIWILDWNAFDLCSLFPKRWDPKWSSKYKWKSSMVITGLFSKTSYEKKPELWPSKISFSISTTISSFSFSGTGCNKKKGQTDGTASVFVFGFG